MRDPGTGEEQRVRAARAAVDPLVGRLAVDVFSWGDPPLNPETEHNASVALLESLLGDSPRKKERGYPASQTASTMAADRFEPLPLELRLLALGLPMSAN